MNYVAVLRKLISVLRKSIKLLVCAGGFSALLGLTLIALSFIRSRVGGPDWFTFGGGIFAAALAGFPLTQILTRMERIETYTEIIMCFEECEQEPPECREQCVRLAEEVIKETSKR